MALNALFFAGGKGLRERRAKELADTHNPFDQPIFALKPEELSSPRRKQALEHIVRKLEGADSGKSGIHGKPTRAHTHDPAWQPLSCFAGKDLFHPGSRALNMENPDRVNIESRDLIRKGDFQHFVRKNQVGPAVICVDQETVNSLL